MGEGRGESEGRAVRHIRALIEASIYVTFTCGVLLAVLGDVQRGTFVVALGILAQHAAPKEG